MQTTKIKIKLKKANVKTLSKAKQTAIRLKTFRTANQQKHPSITVAATENKKSNTNSFQNNQNKLKYICNSLQNLTQQFQRITQNQKQNNFPSSFTKNKQQKQPNNKNRSKKNQFQHTPINNQFNKNPTPYSYSHHKQTTNVPENL
jgi:hypothetical protein